MAFYINEEINLFQINAGSSSYVIKEQGGYLMHLYWGPSLSVDDHSFMIRGQWRCSFNAVDDSVGPAYSPDVMRMEYPCFGAADVKNTALEIVNADGSNIVDLRYVGYNHSKGKPRIEGLPATYGSEYETETLEIIMKDEYSNIEVSLFYSVFESLNAVCRWSVIKNNGKSAVSIKRALSASVDFDRNNFDFLNNYGVWARERQVEWVPLFNGVQEIYSRRGSSSHAHNPYLILKDKNASQRSGEVYGMVLAYSGNFKGLIDVDQYRQSRVQIGINPDGFSWELAPGESFSTPEADLVFSDTGVNGLSQTYHRLYRDKMCRGKYKNTRRPILLNLWEGCYFDFDGDRVVSIAKEAVKLGVELLVIDDGWFGTREDAEHGLGDWYPNPKRFPNGIKPVSDAINELGMKLGIWFEPEMINKKSELFVNHPEWVLHVEGRPISSGRDQYMLDLSREDVCDYLFGCISKVITEGNIDYIKWDYNRNFAEVGSSRLPASKQSEVSHRFILGLYNLLERLITAYPDVLFESCSGGGGRFDAGMLYYMPQTWASDNTDAISRLKIQYGTAMVYPLSCISAHVSDCPNHQTGLTRPFSTRRAVAFTGSFGFELNPLRISEEDKKNMLETSKMYAELGDLFVNGTYYTLLTPYEGNFTSWMYVSADQNEAFVVVVNSEGLINDMLPRVRLCGLRSDTTYTDKFTGKSFSASQLENYGLQTELGNGDSQIWHLVRMPD